MQSGSSAGAREYRTCTPGVVSRLALRPVPTPQGEGPGASCVRRRPLAGRVSACSSSARARPSRCSVVGCDPNQNWLHRGGSSSLSDLVASCTCIRSNAVEVPGRLQRGPVRARLDRPAGGVPHRARQQRPHGGQERAAAPPPPAGPDAPPRPGPAAAGDRAPARAGRCRGPPRRLRAGCRPGRRGAGRARARAPRRSAPRAPGRPRPGCRRARPAWCCRCRRRRRSGSSYAGTRRPPARRRPGRAPSPASAMMLVRSSPCGSGVNWLNSGSTASG